MDIDIQTYTMMNASLRKDARTKLMRLEVPGLAENRPSVLKGDRLYATFGEDNRKYEGFVHKVELREVALGFQKRYYIIVAIMRWTVVVIKRIYKINSVSGCMMA